jgi:hypothetical protein
MLAKISDVWGRQRKLGVCFLRVKITLLLSVSRQLLEPWSPALADGNLTFYYDCYFDSFIHM